MEPKVWRSMGLFDDEYEKIKELMGREPNFLEVGIFAVFLQDIQADSEEISYRRTTGVAGARRKRRDCGYR